MTSCPALVPMVRGMVSHAAWGATGIRHETAPLPIWPMVPGSARMESHAAWGTTGIRNQDLPTPHLTQRSRLCYPWFEAWGPMPPGVQPGSGTKLPHSPFGPNPWFETWGPMPPGVQPGSGTKPPHSPCGPGCPAFSGCRPHGHASGVWESVTCWHAPADFGNSLIRVC